MNIAAWSVKHRAIVYSIVAIMMAFGSVSFLTMPRREDPEFTIRTCVVSTVWPGAPAERVEELITDKLEEVLEGIEEVDELRSTTVTGQSTIFVDCDDKVDPEAIQNVWDKVRAKVELVEMPAPSIRPIVNDEFGDTAVIVLAVHQTPSHGRKQIRPEDQYSPRELDIFADTVKDELRLLPGVAKVERHGVRDEAIFIETDLGTWSKLALTADQLRGILEDRNIVQSGGDLNTAAGRFTVNPGGELLSPVEIEKMIVSAVSEEDTSNMVYLRDLGLTVKRDYEDPPAYLCRFGDATGSSPAVMVAVTMKSGSNIIEICDSVKEKVAQLVDVRQALPGDITVTPVSDQSENVAKKIGDVVVNVVEAILIVIVVVLLIVGLRSSIVMAANIPVVVLASIGIVTFFGVQLEQISLASIIIALGLLVDNAVQVCDQSRSNQINGMNPVDAAVEAAKTLAGPMLVGTLTTVAAFLPMLIALEGGGKEYVYSLPVTLSVCLGLSWFLAMSFCVLLSIVFIRPPKPGSAGSPLLFLVALLSRNSNKGRSATNSDSESNLAFALYSRFVGITISAKWLTLGLTLVLLVSALSLPVSSEFFPQDQRDQFAVEIWLPETATIQQTNAKALEVEQLIRSLGSSHGMPGTNTGKSDETGRLRAMRTLVGGGGSRWHLGWNPEAHAQNYAEILIRTTDGMHTPGFAADLRRVCAEGDSELGIRPITGARIVPVELALGPPADPVVIRVVGNGFADIAELRGFAAEVKELIVNEPGTWDVNDSWGVSGMQVSIDVNEERANLAGVSNVQIADSLSSYFSGLKLTTFREDDHLVPVYFRLRAEDRTDIAMIRNAYVEGANEKIPLDAIAKIRPHWAPATIARRDMNRAIEVRAQVENGVSGNDVVNRIMKSSEMDAIRNRMPEGFSVEIGGALEESADASVQMLTSFGISFFLIVFCLIVQYNGWAKPIIILATLPMAMIGAIPGLYFTGNAIGFMPQLGILSLFGIVLNTGIIFIEFADILVTEKIKANPNGSGPIMGLTREEFRQCLVDAGKQRMLPIFLTTATTIGGLIPLALSGGPLWEGLAWCMIFGLAAATLLTLFVVPALYAILVETFNVQPVPSVED